MQKAGILPAGATLIGQTLVDVTVHGPLGSAEVNALADTGSTFNKVPRAAIEKIGAESPYETAVELADVEFQGIRRPVLVSIAEDGDRALLGYTTLETLGIKVNSVTLSLEPTPAIEY